MFTRRFSGGLIAESSHVSEKSAMPSHSTLYLWEGEACLPSVRRGMGFFGRTHLPHQSYSGLGRGPIRGLQCNDLMESTTFRSGRPQRGPLSIVGVDAS